MTPVVPPPNHAPVVSAGPDRALRQPQTTLVLDGTVADDGRPGGVLSQAWSVVSGPGPVVFGDAASTSTSARSRRREATFSASARATASSARADETTVFYASATALPDLAVKTVDASTIVVDPAVAVAERLGGCRDRQLRRGPGGRPLRPHAVRGPQRERRLRRRNRRRPRRRGGRGSRRLRDTRGGRRRSRAA